jgi:hypothetical protein
MAGYFILMAPATVAAATRSQVTEIAMVRGLARQVLCGGAGASRCQRFELSEAHAVEAMESH